jgi:ribonuclease-3
MRTRGLPAVVRAVPARLFMRPRCSEHRGRRTPGSTLLSLIEDLPAELHRKALTHSSRSATRIESNERLEFLGDSVLGLAIASELFRRYPEHEEGDLARLKAFVVSRTSCAQVAELLEVGRLMTAQMEGLESGRGKPPQSRATLGNTLEALIGAVFLTFGFEQTRLAVVEAFEAQVRYGISAHVDHKTVLQELLAPRGFQPEYRLVAECGPAHARVFSSEVSVNGVVRGQGTGTTIKMSEQAAAREALDSLTTGLGEN